MPAGVYLHIPFCKSRCSYCDFATDVYRDSGAGEQYVNSICLEIYNFLPQINADDANMTAVSDLRNSRSSAAKIGVEIDTVYFGGGTPSLLTPEQIERILTSVREQFEVSTKAEITMEMNPATVTAEKLEAFRALGINRASFGVQTFNERDLKLLARGHDANDARQTYRMLRDAGFGNVSFDLIAGLPEQTMEDWSRNLNEAMAMEPEHLSLYLLEIHESTPLSEQLRSGRRTQIGEELAAEMYQLMIDRLSVAGYQQYEISNFAKRDISNDAKPSVDAPHNTNYWLLPPVYGFGVSAHSFDGTQRYANERDTAKYVGMINASGSAEIFRETIDLASEFAFLGLRLNEGIDLDAYEHRFETNLATMMIDQIENGLVEISSGRIRLTRKGMLYSNEVFVELI